MTSVRGRRGRRIAVLLVVSCLVLACQGTPAATPTGPPATPAVAAAMARAAPDQITLPAPRTSGSLSLEETLARRRSVRDYTKEPLSMAEISQLLWACQGIAVGVSVAVSVGVAVDVGGMGVGVGLARMSQAESKTTRDSNTKTSRTSRFIVSPSLIAGSRGILQVPEI